jgi:hypothetical protein
VLDESIDQRHHASCALEDRAPLFVGHVGGDYRRSALVPSADDVVHEVGCLPVAGEIADLVDHQ